MCVENMHYKQTYSHRFQHLSSTIIIDWLEINVMKNHKKWCYLPNNRLTSQITLGNHHFLGNKYTLKRDFDTHILSTRLRLANARMHTNYTYLLTPRATITPSVSWRISSKFSTP